MNQVADHNMEEHDGLYTRPTLDLYYVNKYWNFLTKGLSKEEVDDLQSAKKQLEHYEKIYSLMEYTDDLSALMTTLGTRIGANNPGVFLTVYRKVLPSLL
jgi:hypothetical protein